jgi:predicted alpha/beta-fold hydrolase
LIAFEQEKELALATAVLKRLREFKSALTVPDFVFGYEAMNALAKKKEPFKEDLKALRLNSIIQVKDCPLTSSQAELTVYVNQVRSQLKKVVFNISNNEITLSKLKNRDLESMISEAKVKSIDQLKLLLNHCNTIEEFLNRITMPVKFMEKVKRLFTTRALGHMQYMRAEAIRLCNGEQINIRVKEGITLEGMIFSAKEFVKDFESIETKSVALLCNPNAGYYEFSIEHQIRWLKFYANRNFDICIWNYRGYGRSQGSPTPFNVISDAQEVINFLKTSRGYTRVLVHGESLGGAVAVKLGVKGGCDFVFADRTFCSIKDEAELIVGKIPFHLMHLVTRWKLEVTDDYINANCYKLIGNDVNDAIINELASLRSGVSRFAVILLKIA